jgi:hypothetical protein
MERLMIRKNHLKITKEILDIGRKGKNVINQMKNSAELG